jgi:hypothetical protein
VATVAALSGSSALGEVTDLILYDVPGTPAALKTILARVDQFGRRTRLNIHVLVPSNDATGMVSGSLELLSRVVGTPCSVDSEEWPPNT